MDRARYDCDVAVVGAGPAGLAAAFRAAREGRRVTVVDDNPDAGGQIKVQVHYKIRSTLSEQEMALLLTSGG